MDRKRMRSDVRFYFWLSVAKYSWEDDSDFDIWIFARYSNGIESIPFEVEKTIFLSRNGESTKAHHRNVLHYDEIPLFDNLLNIGNFVVLAQTQLQGTRVLNQIGNITDWPAKKVILITYGLYHLFLIRSALIICRVFEIHKHFCNHLKNEVSDVFYVVVRICFVIYTTFLCTS